MALAIVNRAPGDLPIPPGIPVWRTCLREVTFADGVDDAPDRSTGAAPLVEGDAYRLLLEILCGLQSPMLGETQVMGQFKTFLSSLDRDHAWLNRLGQRLLADARDIRTQHLQGLGSRSYGSAVRRYLADCQHAALIGTGKLAREVLPFLTDDGRSVDQWGRGTEDETSNFELRTSNTSHDLATSMRYHQLDHIDGFPISPVPTTLIIAAPVPSDVIDRVATRYGSVQCVIDLRGELGCAPLHVAAPIVTLQDLFARMSAATGSAAHHVAAARTEILSRSRRYELRDELRPFGWDDLCA